MTSQIVNLSKMWDMTCNGNVEQHEPPKYGFSTKQFDAQIKIVQNKL